MTGSKLLYLSATSFLPEMEIDRPVIFLVEPYLTEPVKERLKNVDYKVMPKIWNDECRLKEAHDYLERVYMSFKEKIGSVLSEIHNVDYPSSFWEIPMASWLLHYLHAMFDRYSRLKRAVELYGREHISLFSCQYDIALPVGFIDFMESISIVDQSASAFYGIVAKGMNIPVLEFNLFNTAETRNSHIEQKGKMNFLNKAFYANGISMLRHLLYRLIPLNILYGKDILMVPYRFSMRERFIFTRKLKASFFPVDKKFRPALQEIDRTLLMSIQADNEFEKIAINLLPRFMPAYLLEEFKSYEGYVRKWNGFKVYFYAHFIYINTPFCYAAAFGRLRGAKIVGAQHGGGTGQYETISNESIERRASDFYITWGWQDSHYSGAQLLPLPQPDLSRYLNKYRPEIETVLWTGTAMPKQLLRFIKKIPDTLPVYLNCKKVFISYLDKDIRKVLVYRPHSEDCGWSSDEKAIFKNYPEVKIEHVGNLYELLRKVKLYICDHQSTSFMEAFATNTPTILFWDNQLRDERKTTIPFFDLLRDLGILFHDPAEAAEQVNAIWDDVQGWWLHPDRQNARLKFMDAFCKADINWQEKWVEAFRKILKKI